MNCSTFQDSLSDYLEGALDSRLKAECAAHRLVCRDCRELYNDVRVTVQTLNGFAFGGEEPEGLEDRIIAATTTGEMLSCNTFDKLLERYFDGVILAPTFQNFQSHFETCSKCRRLLAGIEDAIAMCRDAKEMDLDVPTSLHDRIVAATVGPKNAGWAGRARNFFFSFANLMWTPQMAAAALIFAASSLLVISRFGSVSGMAEHAETKAKRIYSESGKRINYTGEKARTGFRNVNAVLFSDDLANPASYQTKRPPRTTKPSPTPTPLDPAVDEHNPDSSKRQQRETKE
ncbi:MAG: anti-sigma factor family protein [Blastocatellia bacterium]